MGKNEGNWWSRWNKVIAWTKKIKLIIKTCVGVNKENLKVGTNMKKTTK